jgi:DNA polymerase (family 10)
MHLPLHTKITNDEIAQIFSFIGQVLGMDPANRFKARAYDEAGVVIHHLDYQLCDAFAKSLKKYKDLKAAQLNFKKELDTLPGIGEAISQKLTELFSTGDIQAFQSYVKDLPAGMYPLMQIHGIGPKKALALTTHFQLNDSQAAIATLLAKAQAGEVRSLEGFGEKSEEELILALQQQHHKGRIPYATALKVAEKFKAALEKSQLIQDVIFLGSLRRGAQTVGDIDLGVAAEDPAQVVKYVKTLPLVKNVLAAGDNLMSVIDQDGWQTDIKFALPSEWGSFMQHFTGDKQHNIQLREYALKKGLSLSEHGIKIKETGKIKTFKTEEAFYDFLGLNWIPPQERVGGDEIAKYKKV